MFHVAADPLDRALEQIDCPVEQLVVIETSPEYPDNLIFQPVCDPQLFYQRYSDWLSRHLVLNELHNLRPFVELLQSDGFHPLFAANTAGLLQACQRWETPLRIADYQLYPFQTFSLNRALERARNGRDTAERFYFWNWSAGAGKSYCSGAGARALFDSGDIDLVIACTLSKLKENLRRTYERDAGLRAVINDHPKPEVRHRLYFDPDIDVFVMNYEKLRVDFDALEALTRGKRVLWILDEAHKLITDAAKNKARSAFDKLVAGCRATIWPMSATVVGGNPLRYRDVFALGGIKDNPLGTRQDFVARYADEVRDIPIRTRSGGRYTITKYSWNLARLQEVRHRVSDRTMAVRKTDPGVRQQFKGIDCLPLPIQASEATQSLFDVITDMAEQAKERGESLAPYYLMLRIAAINPEGLRYSEMPQAAELVDRHPLLINHRHSTKIEAVNDLLESIRESQDKAVLFCHWTTLGLLPLAKHLTVPHVLHYGTGQSARESQLAQDRFKTDPDITCFASSDAGTHGLNFQCARYVINVDPVYSYDDLAQRNARIDRADSHLDGLTAYVLITENSVEERVWAVCDERRRLAAAVQGTAEELSYGHSVRGEMDDLDYLIFGERN